VSNGNANTHVTKINLKGDGTMDIFVQFDGFKTGEDVEISGYVTQTEGAYSSFQWRGPVPSSSDAAASGTEEVTVNIPKMGKLRNQADITIVTEVKKVWPTVLKSDPENPSEQDTVNPVQDTADLASVKATWNAQEPGKGARWP
jgi:hypothetical protein